MEEILHHLECIKPCKQWDKLPTSTGDRRSSFIKSRDYDTITLPLALDDGESPVPEPVAVKWDPT